ncbi:MAG TPA: glycosyltransferase [Thermoanaerobaculia bacterium]|jgi:glycosyltransferase involved in cell wall biosynthesis|nr:glycosyltransferase [Thermoanaerobaculia bacterium]
MRILHVIPTYLPAWRHGGPVLAVHGLCKALVARGHEVTVFTTNVHGDGTLDVPLGKPVHIDRVAVQYFPVRLPRRLYFAPGLRKTARDSIHRFDVVHLHSVFLWPTSAVARAAERAGIPYVLSPRGMLVPELIRSRGRWRKLAWMALAERRTIERAAALHATSPLEAEEAGRLGLRLPGVFVVPNGIDAETWTGNGSAPSSTVEGLLAGSPFLLFLGRLSWKKGLDRLIPAMARVPDTTLAIAGNDEEDLRPALERLAEQAGVADRVTFVGPVHGTDKAALLHRAAALVLPSYSENFGNVVLESWAAGRPVAVTPTVGLADTVRETAAGIVAEGDSAQLGDALRDLLNDPVRLNEMGQRGATAVRERFGWAAVAKEMEALYEQVRVHPR